MYLPVLGKGLMSVLTQHIMFDEFYQAEKAGLVSMAMAFA
jgi:hypothetical protein